MIIRRRIVIRVIITINLKISDKSNNHNKHDDVCVIRYIMKNIMTITNYWKYF